MNTHNSKQGFAKEHFFNDERYTPEIIEKLYKCMSDMEWNNDNLIMKKLTGDYSTCLQGNVMELMSIGSNVIEFTLNALREYNIDIKSSLFPVEKVIEQGSNYIINYDNDEWEYYDTIEGIKSGRWYVSSYESKREHNLKRFHTLLRSLKYFPNYAKYNIVDGINFYEFDIYESHYAKKLALMSLLNLDQESLDAYVTRVSLKYTDRLDYNFDHQCKMKVLKVIIDSIIKNNPKLLSEPMVSRFIRIINGIHIHDEIIRVKDIILENNNAFDNLFDTYMYKSHYKIILNYATNIVKEIESSGTTTFDEDKLVQSLIGVQNENL